MSFAVRQLVMCLSEDVLQHYVLLNFMVLSFALGEQYSLPIPLYLQYDSY